MGMIYTLYIDKRKRLKNADYSKGSDKMDYSKISIIFGSPYNSHYVKVVGETEKAVQLQVDERGFRPTRAWFPKSALTIRDGFSAEVKKWLKMNRYQEIVCGVLE